ncbi:MAG TPA: DUF4124 domain-containing protein [Burkholderiaceae bacterium]|nr:DUF4124 domain-containing protein [Burkholderiaceae bacterium]
MRRYVLAITVALAVTPIAQAQWAWKDASGAMVFSDQPPPSNIKPSQIVREPRNVPRPTGGALDQPAPTPAAAPAAPAPQQKTTAELEAEFRKRQMERAEAEKKAGEEAQRKKQAADACERARAYTRMLDDGIRIRLDNGDIANDAQRASERARAQESIKQHC